jgi:L-threonylcarbamoyladenylate synthase
LTAVTEAAAVLEQGGVVVVPTDTVYGLAASISQDRAIRRIFELKDRPADRALPVLAPDTEAAMRIGVLDAGALSLASRFWPGPLTLVVRRTPGFDVDLGGRDDDTVGVRVPDHPMTLELLSLAGPLAVTSANRTGRSPAQSAAQARRDLAIGDDVMVLDGGHLNGAPSTVVSLVGDPWVLREGVLSRGDLGL